MKYIKAFGIVILISLIMPFLYTAAFMEPGDQKVPNLPMSAILEMSKSEAAAYLQNPENYHVASGANKIFRVTLSQPKYFFINSVATFFHIFIGLIIYHAFFVQVKSHNKAAHAARCAGWTHFVRLWRRR